MLGMVGQLEKTVCFAVIDMLFSPRLHQTVKSVGYARLTPRRSAHASLSLGAAIDSASTDVRSAIRAKATAFDAGTE